MNAELTLEEIKNMNMIKEQDKVKSREDAELLAGRIFTQVRLEEGLEEEDFIAEFQSHLAEGTEGPIIQGAREIADHCPNLLEHALMASAEAQGKSWGEMGLGTIALLLLYMDMSRK